MKLPFSLDLQFIFRLLFPGVVLATAFFPLAWLAVTRLSVSVDPSYLFIMTIFFWGWLTVMLDVPIYMLFEGRRFWPGRVRRFMERSEERRLGRIQRRANPATTEKDNARYLEAIAEKQTFPIRDDGVPYVEYPTRLGNCISSFESYPDVKYGIQAAFFWSRLWVKLDVSLRKEVDDLQAIADSGLYMAFALYLLAAMMVVYSTGELLFGIQFPYIHNSAAGLWLWVPVSGLAYGIYRSNIFVQLQYGDVFKSIFDQYRHELPFDDVSAAIDRFIQVPEGGFDQLKHQYVKVWRYLQWHRVRPGGEDKNYTVGEWCQEKNRREDTH